MACKHVNHFYWLVLGKTQTNEALLRPVEPPVKVIIGCPKAAPLLHLQDLERLNRMRLLLAELLVNVLLVHRLQLGVQQDSSNVKCHGLASDWLSSCFILT